MPSRVGNLRGGPAAPESRKGWADAANRVPNVRDRGQDGTKKGSQSVMQMGCPMMVKGGQKLMPTPSWAIWLFHFSWLLTSLMLLRPMP